jgi:ABC-type glucose/galactose transport system permease subunit
VILNLKAIIEIKSIALLIAGLSQQKKRLCKDIKYLKHNLELAKIGDVLVDVELLSVFITILVFAMYAW